MEGEVKTGTLREDESRRLSNQDFPSPESTVREIAGLVPKIKTIVFDQEVIIGSGVSDETNIVIDDSQIHSRKRNEICISLRQCKCPSQRLFKKYKITVNFNNPLTSRDEGQCGIVICGQSVIFCFCILRCWRGIPGMGSGTE